jgi:hypothetical protein
MKDRCGNPNTRFWERYGGRGITVCERWAASFEAFLADMGPRPTPRHSLERKDGNGAYDPENCVWALPEQQSKNRVGVRIIVHDGVTDTMAGWARRTGVPYLKLRRRLEDGWPASRAFDPHL